MTPFWSKERNKYGSGNSIEATGEWNLFIDRDSATKLFGM